MTRLSTLVVALALGTSGCSLLSEHRSLGQEAVVNPQGHVVGQKETLRSRSTGEEVTRIALYAPWYSDGRIAGYEQRTRSGSIIRDLKGNVIGARYDDLRSRGTNANSRGFTVVFAGPASRKGVEAADLIETAQAAPAALDYVKLASLSFARP